ncbi:MAG: hypothetical protein V7641_4826 [Blastocatellia bacterium]
MQRQNFASFMRRSRVLWLSLLVVMCGALLESAAAGQSVSFGAKADFVTGSFPGLSVAVGDFNGDGTLDLAVTNIVSGTVSILLNTTPVVFTLGFDSPTVTAQAGTTVRVTVNINRAAGFTGNVTVTPPASAMGIKPKSSIPITTTDTSLTFKLKIKGGASLGPHTETFTARDDAGHTSTATLTVTVQ